jgi:hypothetical protein
VAVLKELTDLVDDDTPITVAALSIAWPGPLDDGTSGGGRVCGLTVPRDDDTLRIVAAVLTAFLVHWMAIPSEW